MRYNEILSEDELFEINMSPSNLQKLAAAIPDARAGLEFEMCVPGAADDDDGDQEPNYDMDERCRSIQDAYDFFYDGDWNSRRSCDAMREKMQEEYLEWLDEKIEKEWDRGEGEEFLHDWIANNVDEEEWNNGDDDPESTREERLDNFVANVHADPSNDYYQSARDEFREEHQEDWDESDWLDDEDLDRMSSIEDRYSMSWPHWTEAESGDVDLSQVVDSFESAVSRSAINGGDYHNMSGRERARANADAYIVERDGSINPRGGDGGLEFVSPPLTIPEMIQDLKDISKWAARSGCYTGSEYKTGLHMNISVPGYSLEKLDYLKLTVLLGDEYILKAFGRMGNTYAISAMSKVKERVRNRPDDAQALLDKMKEHLEAAATKAIHSGVTDKYTSINTKDNRVEFRSPGGDWLGDYKKDPGKIVNTMLRMVVALDAACNPDKYRQEYQTKLYKLLSANDKGDDTIRYFTEYVAGKIPRAALRSFVKQAQLERSTRRGKFDGQKMWWKVYRNGKGRDGASVELVATSEKEARQKAAQGWNDTINPSRYEVEVLRPYDEKANASANGPNLNGRPSNPDGNYVIVDQDDRTRPVYRYQASDSNDALLVLQQWIAANRGTTQWTFMHDPNQIQGQPPGGDNAGPGERVIDNTLKPTGPGPWEVYNRATGNSTANLVRGGQPITDRGTAQRLAMDLIAVDRHDLYGVRTRGTEGERSSYSVYGANRVYGHYDSQRDALEAAQQLANDNGTAVHVAVGGRRIDTATPQTRPAASNEPRVWIVRRITDNGPGPKIYVRATDEQSARDEVRQSHPDLLYAYLDVQAAVANAVPDVAPDVAQNFPQDRTDGRTINFGNQFSGQWKVMVNGQEVWRFRGVGNNQADANRIAAQWLRDNGQGVSGEGYEVVPVMI